MLHVDIPTQEELERLITTRDDACVSIYLPTTPVTQEAGKSRILLGNLARTALEQLRAIECDRRAVDAIGELLADLEGDERFWAFQATSLAVFLTPDGISTFRLPSRLAERVEVADRFHTKPLLRAAMDDRHAFVLALSQASVRLLEVTADLPPAEVRVPDLPSDMGDALGRGSLESRSPRGRIQGSEGKKVRMAQYARAVDAALRGLLGGRRTALILAAAAPLDSIFRHVCSYPQLAEQVIEGNPEGTPDHELARAAHGILDALHADRVAAFARRFEERAGQKRATTAVEHAGRAAIHGAIEALAIDIDASIPGTLDHADGTVAFAAAKSAETYGIVDQIAAEALVRGARVLAVRREDIPGGGELAAILRYPI